MMRSDFIADVPEPELLRPAMSLEGAAAQHEKADRARRLNAQAFEIAEIANARRPSLVDDSLGRNDADARNAQ
jgi:hypothetical protein